MQFTARCHSHPHRFSAEDMDDEGVPSKVPAQSIPTWVDRDDGDESSSVSSDSCWGEMEDLNGAENVEWGLTPLPGPVQTTSHSVPVDVLSALEQGLCEDVPGSRSPSLMVPASHVATALDSPAQEVHRDGVPPRFGPKEVLVPGSPDATPQSIQDRFLADEAPLTDAVSMGGANLQPRRGDGLVMFQNRFAPLIQDGDAVPALSTQHDGHEVGSS